MLILYRHKCSLVDCAFILFHRLTNLMVLITRDSVWTPPTVLTWHSLLMRWLWHKQPNDLCRFYYRLVTFFCHSHPVYKDVVWKPSLSVCLSVCLVCLHLNDDEQSFANMIAHKIRRITDDNEKTDNHLFRDLKPLCRTTQTIRTIQISKTTLNSQTILSHLWQTSHNM